MICNADARQIPLSNNSVQCVITSPPYFGLRDYGVGGQIGLEDSLEDYIEALCCVFDGLWAALRDDGTVWLNLGDSYAGNNSRASHGGRAGFGTPRECIVKRGTKSKDLMFVPHRVAIALQERGWYVRQDIVWHKPNPMPESVTDRCTRAHEYIFMLTKSPRYYYDAASISERAQPHLGKVLDVRSSGTGLARAGISGNPDRAGNFLSTNGFANKRSVWTVTTKPFSGAHFATFPPDLVEPMILAGCPEGGVILDPFCGSGTVGMVCRKHSRKFVGLDLSMEYLSTLALPRSEQQQTKAAIEELPLFGGIE